MTSSSLLSFARLLRLWWWSAWTTRRTTWRWRCLEKQRWWCSCQVCWLSSCPSKQVPFPVISFHPLLTYKTWCTSRGILSLTCTTILMKWKRGLIKSKGKEINRKDQKIKLLDVTRVYSCGNSFSSKFPEVLFKSAYKSIRYENLDLLFPGFITTHINLLIFLLVFSSLLILMMMMMQIHLRVYRNSRSTWIHRIPSPWSRNRWASSPGLSIDQETDDWMERRQENHGSGFFFMGK